MIPDSILEQYDGRILLLGRDEMLFAQGDAATYFYLVRCGKMKMATYNDQGREFVQGYFTEGQSFGEPPFFNHTPYPASAIAVVESEIWRSPYDSFIRLLREHFEIHLQLTEVLSRRLVYKSMMLTEIAVEEAEHRLTTLIDYFRRNDGVASDEAYRVRFTRQQLADMTGLRVETVIRTIKGLEGKGELRIKEGKIYWSGLDAGG